jgi:very-short-patch-repair endonuclease
MQSEEAALWRLLRGKRLEVRFVRQHVIGRFVVDFAAPVVRLAVEVDGGYHALRTAADARRDAKLRRWGWRVLRLDARLVVAHPAEAVARIRAALG